MICLIHFVCGEKNPRGRNTLPFGGRALSCGLQIAIIFYVLFCFVLFCFCLFVCLFLRKYCATYSPRQQLFTYLDSDASNNPGICVISWSLFVHSNHYQDILLTQSLLPRTIKKVLLRIKTMHPEQN